MGVSPDGKFLVAPNDDARLALFPVDGGEPRVLPGVDRGQLFVQWTEDGKSIYVRDDTIPVLVYKLDLATGKKNLVLRLMPPDPSGVMGVP